MKIKKLLVTSLVALPLLLGFTLPKYNVGNAVVDEKNLISEQTEENVQGVYNEIMDHSNVHVITLVDHIPEESLESVSQAALDSWQGEFKVIAIVNPETKHVKVVSTEKIDETKYEQDLKNALESGDFEMGLKDYYKKVATEFERDDTVRKSTTPETPEITFNTFDYIILGIVVLGSIGGLSYGFYQVGVYNKLEKDEKVFENYLNLNPDIKRRELWEILEDEGTLSNSWIEFKEYLRKK